MFEQTYEQNCHPHTPKWSAQAIGPIGTMMKRIFASASSCEGGMLQGAGGRTITPEGYIAGWLKELENPVSMRDLDLGMKVSESWSASLTEADLVEMKPTMLALGYESQVKDLEAGLSISITLHADSHLLSAIYNGETKGAWRVIQSYDTPVHGTRDESLGYKPEKAKVYDVATQRCLRVSKENENILIQRPDGSWRCEGWAHSIIGQFVANLWAAELREPGSYRNRIKVLREAVLSAPMVPANNTKVIIDTSVPVEDYKQRSMANLLNKVSHIRHGSELHFSVPEDYDTLYSVTNLPVASTKWVVVESAPMEQLSLLAG
ncbi:hypothetical protein OKW11_005923 [Pseudomonas baetica]|nr:hypothetical protein [Pseudomonas baetica]